MSGESVESVESESRPSPPFTGSLRPQPMITGVSSSHRRPPSDASLWSLSTLPHLLPLLHLASRLGSFVSSGDRREPAAGEGNEVHHPPLSHRGTVKWHVSFLSAHRNRAWPEEATCERRGYGGEKNPVTISFRDHSLRSTEGVRWKDSIPSIVQFSPLRSYHFHFLHSSLRFSFSHYSVSDRSERTGLSDEGTVEARRSDRGRMTTTKKLSIFYYHFPTVILPPQLRSLPPYTRHSLINAVGERP